MNLRDLGAWIAWALMFLALVYAGRHSSDRGGRAMSEQITSAAERVRAYLDEMDRIDAIRPQYADEVHGINDYVLARSDVRAVLDQPQRVQPSREEVLAALKGVWFNLSDEFLGRFADAALALFAQQPTVAEVNAEAWDEGHRHAWRRGPDECMCSAWSSNECMCGLYGSGELLSLADNPYREARP